MDMSVKNETMADREVCTKFELFGEAIANLTMANIVIYPALNEVEISDVTVVQSEIVLDPKDYDVVFGDYFNMEAANFNEQYAKGWSLTNIDPRFAFLGGLIKNITATPYVSDEWFYGGFSMYADSPIEGIHSTEYALTPQPLVAAFFEYFELNELLHSYE